jgi:phosphoribosylanthranilate isomerase
MFGPRVDNQIVVKICGITNEADAVTAIESGADALGFNLSKLSARCIDIELERGWIERLPNKVCRVAVMVNPTIKEALQTAALPFINLVQLHGQESAEFCRTLAEARARFAKAIPVTNADSLVGLPSFHTKLIILDSASDGRFGGSGQSFPWRIARGFVQAHSDLNVVLAGGLTPENVSRAIKEVHPFGVDVTSGVEISKGKKDRLLLEKFIAAVRAAAS